jgi:NAD(P)-dependent dehydrogenase (short-subunit alcohol dehydrogenase family)
MLLKNKYLMISGIGPGLGIKLALNAAAEGAAGIAISARTAASLDAAEERLREAGATCQIVKCVTDICDAQQCRDFTDQALNAFGRIDALVNNAHFHGPMGQRIESADFSYWRPQFETNVIGTLQMTQAVLPSMKAQKEGSIVMISTLGVKTPPTEDVSGYCASKAALYNATRKLAMEVGRHNVRVNSLHPGVIWSEAIRAALAAERDRLGTEEDAYKALSANTALQRLATDDECARAALFLASDYSSAMTGASLDVNAGAFMP